ncbi:hypothetical protein [Pararhizobium sp. PWRC1-1]|uniref:hypothetical protein n=1 Tax=Pararhizobium sp. PWRC1-1 TaxID=2804566 RepID=UPI003CF945D1
MHVLARTLFVTVAPSRPCSEPRSIGGESRRGSSSAHDAGDLLKIEKQTPGRLDDFILNGEDVRHLAIEFLGEDMRAGQCIDQLYRWRGCAGQPAERCLRARNPHRAVAQPPPRLPIALCS